VLVRKLGESFTVPIRNANTPAAIQQMEADVDNKIACYRGNPLVSDITKDIKAKYRHQILDRGTSERG
jgi:hypothetical protein